jgi:hypothetical protein
VTGKKHKEEKKKKTDKWTTTQQPQKWTQAMVVDGHCMYTIYHITRRQVWWDDLVST